MKNLSNLLESGEIIGIGYIPKKTGVSEKGMTTVVKNKNRTITIHNPDGDNDGAIITDTGKKYSIIWENIEEPA